MSARNEGEERGTVTHPGKPTAPQSKQLSTDMHGAGVREGAAG